jgi:hypothetical protein
VPEVGAVRVHLSSTVVVGAAVGQIACVVRQSPTLSQEAITEEPPACTVPTAEKQSVRSTRDTTSAVAPAGHGTHRESPQRGRASIPGRGRPAIRQSTFATRKITVIAASTITASTARITLDRVTGTPVLPRRHPTTLMSSRPAWARSARPHFSRTERAAEPKRIPSICQPDGKCAANNLGTVRPSFGRRRRKLEPLFSAMTTHLIMKEHTRLSRQDGVLRRCRYRQIVIQPPPGPAPRRVPGTSTSWSVTPRAGMNGRDSGERFPWSEQSLRCGGVRQMSCTL